MKCTLLITAVFTILVGASLAKKCRCWNGYKVEAIPEVEGAFHCRNVRVMHTMACNVPQPPPCICNGHSGVLMDRTGTWCTVYENGVEIRRWKCENTFDWDRFIDKYNRYYKKN